MELAAGEHGAAPPHSKTLGPAHGRGTRDPAETGAARTRTPDSCRDPPDRARPHQRGQGRAPAAAWATRHPPRPGTPVRAESGHHHPKGPHLAAGGPPEGTSLHGPATTGARRPSVPGNTPGAQGRAAALHPRRPAAATCGQGTRTTQAGPGRPGTKNIRDSSQITATYPQPTLGPPLPGPADYALQG